MEFTKRQILKALVFFCLMLLTIVSDSGALEPECSSSLYEMDEIVVTAVRSEIRRQNASANITVITRKDIENMPASNVAEILQYIPGVYVEFNGGLGSEAVARIQGSEIRHVTVLQDGVPLNQLANPRTDLSYLPVDAIDRIEVYKGAASAAWGSALGGVINIVTKDPDTEEPFAADLRSSYGEFATSKSRGTASGTLGRFGYLISMTHDQSDGFIENTQYEQDAVYAKFNYLFGTANRMDFIHSYDEGSNADPLLNFPAFWDDIYRKRTFQRLSFEIAPSESLVMTFEGRHHRFYSLIHDVYSTQRVVYNDYLDETWGGSARLHWEPSGATHFNLGVDGDWGRYDWNNYVKEYTTGNRAVYLNTMYIADRVTLNAGMRYDDNQEFGGAYSPSLGAVYHHGTNVLVRAQVARGFSAPPASWVHDPNFGNPNLEPEVAMNYQLGGEIRAYKFLRLELNLFRSDVDDLIRYDSDSRQWENIDAVTRQGVEGSVSADLDFGLRLSFGGSFVDVKDDRTDEVIRDIPRTTMNVSASYSNGWISHSVVGKYIHHNSTYQETHDQVFIFDYLLKAILPFPKKYVRPSLFGAVYNIFDTAYLYRKVWPKPGRWVEGGVRFEF